jgi:DivIVA domain-containing protein
VLVRVLATHVFDTGEEPSMGGSPPDAIGLPGPTPEEVRTATFNQSQLGWRGYSEDEVRSFLSQVADWMVAAEKERAGLLSEIDRLRSYYRNQGQDVDTISNGSAGRRPGSARGGDLLQQVQAYVEVQVTWATKYAFLIDSREEEKANTAFQHASVQAALVVRESIRQSMASTYGYAAVDGELGRASRWLRAFYHALHAQLQVTNEALMKAAKQT